VAFGCLSLGRVVDHHAVQERAPAHGHRAHHGGLGDLLARGAVQSLRLDVASPSSSQAPARTYPPPRDEPAPHSSPPSAPILSPASRRTDSHASLDATFRFSTPNDTAPAASDRFALPGARQVRSASRGLARRMDDNVPRSGRLVGGARTTPSRASRSGVGHGPAAGGAAGGRRYDWLGGDRRRRGPGRQRSRHDALHSHRRRPRNRSGRARRCTARSRTRTRPTGADSRQGVDTILSLAQHTPSQAEHRQTRQLRALEPERTAHPLWPCRLGNDPRIRERLNEGYDFFMKGDPPSEDARRRNPPTSTA
jgi:hypothetical protein